MSADTALAQRYGRRPAGQTRRRVTMTGAVLALLVVGWAVGVGWQTAHTPVRWQDGRFTATDDGSGEYRFRVTTEPGGRVVCTVRIFNPGLTEVGRTDVWAGPSTTEAFLVVAQVPTVERGTSGTVRACLRR